MGNKIPSTQTETLSINQKKKQQYVGGIVII